MDMAICLVMCGLNWVCSLAQLAAVKRERWRLMCKPTWSMGAHGIVVLSLLEQMPLFVPLSGSGALDLSTLCLVAPVLRSLLQKNGISPDIQVHPVRRFPQSRGRQFLLQHFRFVIRTSANATSATFQARLLNCRSQS